MDQFNFSTDTTSEYSDDLMEAAKHFTESFRALARIIIGVIMQQTTNTESHRNRVEDTTSRLIGSLHDQEKLALSVGEVSKLMGLSRNLVYELIRTSQIPSIKLGQRILIPRQKLEMMLS